MNGTATRTSRNSHSNSDMNRTMPYTAPTIINTGSLSSKMFDNCHNTNNMCMGTSSNKCDTSNTTETTTTTNTRNNTINNNTINTSPNAISNGSHNSCENDVDITTFIISNNTNNIVSTSSNNCRDNYVDTITCTMATFIIPKRYLIIVCAQLVRTLRFRG